MRAVRQGDHMVARRLVRYVAVVLFIVFFVHLTSGEQPFEVQVQDATFFHPVLASHVPLFFH
jgi:hypothetical protein